MLQTLVAERERMRAVVDAARVFVERVFAAKPTDAQIRRSEAAVDLALRIDELDSATST